MESNIQSKIIEFFKKNPKPKDDDFHEFVESLGMEHSKGEEEVYKIMSEIVSGGRSKGNKSKVNPGELKLGIKIESEHVKNPIIQEKIARDHLDEDPKYYSKLKKMESGMEKAKRKLVPIYENLYLDLNKARPTKYIKRIPKAGGKGYNYIYAEDKKKVGIFSSIMSFFGFKDEKQAKAQVKKTYDENKSKLGGASLEVFTDHMAEYLANKSKWDKALAGKEKAPGEKKKVEVAKEGKKVTVKKPGEKAGPKWSIPLMRAIAGITEGISKKEKQKESDRQLAEELKESYKNFSTAELIQKKKSLIAKGPSRGFSGDMEIGSLNIEINRRESEDNFDTMPEREKERLDLGDYKNPDSLTDQQIYNNVLEAAKMPMKQLEKNDNIIQQQIEMAKKQGKGEKTLKQLDFMGVIYRVAQLHKDQAMDMDEIVSMVDMGAELEREQKDKDEDVKKEKTKDEPGNEKWKIEKNGKKYSVSKTDKMWRVQSSPTDISMTGLKFAKSPEEAIENHEKGKNKVDTKSSVMSGGEDVKKENKSFAPIFDAKERVKYLDGLLEGELIYNSGKKASGKKMSKEERDSLRQYLNNVRSRLGLLPTEKIPSAMQINDSKYLNRLKKDKTSEKSLNTQKKQEQLDQQKYDTAKQNIQDIEKKIKESAHDEMKFTNDKFVVEGSQFTPAQLIDIVKFGTKYDISEGDSKTLTAWEALKEKHNFPTNATVSTAYDIAQSTYEDEFISVEDLKQYAKSQKDMADAKEKLMGEKMFKATQLIKTADGKFLLLKKAKTAPVGAISPDGTKKKAADGTWVPIKGKGKPKSGEEKPSKPGEKPEKKEPQSKDKESIKEKLKETLKKMTSILAEALSGKETVAPTGQAVEQAGEKAKSKDKIKKEKDKKKKPEEKKPKEDNK